LRTAAEPKTSQSHTRFRAGGYRKGGQQLLNTNADWVPTVVRKN